MNNKTKEILHRIIAAIMTCLMCIGTIGGILPTTVMAATAKYNLHEVSSLSNTDALYKEYAEANGLKLGYLTNFNNATITITHSDFHTKTLNGTQYVYTAASKLPKSGGRDEATVWENVATFTYKNAGYVGDDKSNTFDIVFKLKKLVALRGTMLSYAYDLSYPYYTPVISSPGEGVLACSYIRDSEMATHGGPYTAENWDIEILDKNGNRLKNVLLAQVYKDLDIWHSSNDQDYSKTFSEGIKLFSGYVEDTYVRANHKLDIESYGSDSNASYRAINDGETPFENQYKWVVTAISSGLASLQWTGQVCGTTISPVVSTIYPDTPDPKKEVDKIISNIGEEVIWTVTQSFPVVNPSNAAKSIVMTDEMDDILNIETGKIKIHAGSTDVTGNWNIKVDGQKITMTAKDPAHVEGKYTYTIPTIVKDGVLDGKTIVVKDGETYAEIPNYAYISINNEPHKSNEVTTLVPSSGISLIKDVDKKHISNAAAGDALKYSFVIENTGKATLHDVELTDSLPVKNLKIDWSGSSDTATGEKVLSPGETVNGFADYALTDADIKAEKVHNTATVTGKDPKGNTVKDDDDADTTLSAVPRIPPSEKDVDKEIVKANETVTWTVNQEFPALGSYAKKIVVEDTFDDILNIQKDAVKVYDGTGRDVTSAWTVTVNGQKATVMANNPASVEGSYSFVFPTIVKDGVLDGKTLVVKAGETYAEIPNTAVIEVNNDSHPSNEVKTLIPASGINIIKDVDKEHIANAKAGDVLNYTFRIRNTEKVTLHEVVLTDSLPVKDLMIDWTSSSDAATGEGVLSPGETVSGSAKYSLTQDDINAGKVHNVATVTGKDPKDNTVTDDDDADTTLSAKAAISLSKTADPKQMTDPSVGDYITYTFAITNTGAVDLTAINFSDDHTLVDLVWDTDLSANLAPGKSINGTARYALTQDDINAGSVLNKADVTAKGTNGESVSDSDQDTTIIKTTPNIQLVKTTPVAILTGDKAKAGTIVDWNFEIKNTGKNTLSNVYIEDHLEGISEISYDWAGSSDAATGDGILSSGETVPAHATYTVADKDIAAKEIINTATAHGTDPYGTEVTSDGSAKIQIKYDPEIEIKKETDTVNYTGAKAGDIINYTISLTNNGNVDLINVEIHDLKEGAIITGYDWPGAENCLAVGETVVAYVDYALTQEDIDVTELKNEAEGVGQAPDGTWVYDTTDIIIKKEFKPAIALVKDVDKKEIKDAKAGDVLTYTVTVTNIGDVTLHNVKLTDSKDGILYDVSFDRVTDTLAPDESFVMTAKYNVAQEDINLGNVLNEADVEGTDPEGTIVTAEDDAETILEQRASDAVTKKASTSKVSATDAKPGYEITYDFTASNTGNVTLHDVTFTDEMLTQAGVEIKWAWTGEGILAPGETITGTAIYNITQADVDAGSIKNVIIMNAKDPGNNPLDPQEAEVITELEKAPAMTVTKEVDKTALDPAAAGDVLNYTFTAANTGNVTLHDVTFTDEMLTEAGVEIKWAWTAEGILAPGETITGTALSYEVTQNDINTGNVINKIRMDAKDPDDKPVDPAEAEVKTVLAQNPAHKVTKSVDKTKVEKPVVGDELNYSFTYTNTGNVTLHDIEFTDKMLSDAGVEIKWDWTKAASKGETASLLPGETITGTATYKLTQADIDRKGVKNVIIANAKDPNEDPVDPVEDTVETEIVNNPKLVLTKDVDKEEIKNAKAGDILNYTFTIKNTGDTTLLSVVINDKLEEIKDLKIDWKSSTDEETEDGVLSPGEEVKGSAAYEVTQSDINAGKVVNVAFATGHTPGDPEEPVNSPEDDAETILEQTSKITIIKSVDLTTLTDPAVGTVLTYTFKITNTGNTTLKDISITDTLTGKGLSAIAYKYNSKDKTLDPGESMTATATYALTAADIASKKVVNTAIANAKDPSDKDVKSDKSTVTTTITTGTTTITTGKTTTTTNRTTGSTGTVSAPKTGDNHYATAAAIVLIVSAILLVFQYRKRKNQA